MFERFTDGARRAVVLAQEEARLQDRSYIGTEHLLLGLIHQEEGVAAKALDSLGISLEAVRQQVDDVVGRGDERPAAGLIPFTPRAKKVLELSLREAPQLGHNYIGTEHLLLALTHEGDGGAAQVLVKLGADPPRVRQRVVQLLSDDDAGDRSNLWLELEYREVEVPGNAGLRSRNRFLRLDDLPADVWAVLQDRQGRLPFTRIRRTWQWHGLSSNEERAALRLADRRGLTEYEGLALLHYHCEAVDRLAADAIPEVLRLADEKAAASLPGEYVTLRFGGRTRRFGSPFPSGWLTWFGNRRAGMRDAWFRLTWRY